MKKHFILLLLAVLPITSFAQDSCYVYTRLHWTPLMTKYDARIQLGEEMGDTPILDENGEKLSFYNILHALNYLSTKGWEFISLSPLNPENNTSINEQYAIIRKIMPIEEAKKYATPKPKKK